MGIEELLKDQREDILRIAAQHGAHNVRVFGSVARGEARPDSDVDLLVELESGRSLLDLGGLLMDLQTLLDAKSTSSLTKAFVIDSRPGLQEARPL